MAFVQGSPTIQEVGQVGAARWEVMAAVKCDNCQRILIARGVYNDKPSGGTSALGMLDRDAYGVTWFPRAGETKEFSDVPAHIAAAASEAYECFSIQAYRAAVAMSRAVVEATAKEKGISNGTLYNKIERMVSEDHLRPGTGAMAHEIRHWGNDSAHGDFTAPIAGEEAEGVLALMSEVLHDAFQSPALLQRVQQSRLGTSDSS